MLLLRANCCCGGRKLYSASLRNSSSWQDWLLQPHSCSFEISSQRLAVHSFELNAAYQHQEALIKQLLWWCLLSALAHLSHSKRSPFGSKLSELSSNSTAAGWSCWSRLWCSRERHDFQGSSLAFSQVSSPLISHCCSLEALMISRQRSIQLGQLAPISFAWYCWPLISKIQWLIAVNSPSYNECGDQELSYIWGGLGDESLTVGCCCYFLSRAEPSLDNFLPPPLASS